MTEGMSGRRKAAEGKELKIDRAVYVVEDKGRTYRYLRRNHQWRDLAPAENERNKRHLDGYTQIFPDGRTKIFRYRPPYTTRVPAVEQGDRLRSERPGWWFDPRREALARG